MIKLHRIEEVTKRIHNWYPCQNKHYGNWIKSLVNELRGSIRFLDINSWGPTSIEINPDKRFVTTLSAVSSPLRDNFVIASFLGNYFLHTPTTIDKPIKFEMYHMPKVQAIEAARFAALLLMPTEEFEAQNKKDHKWDKTMSIASYFSVTVDAVKARLSLSSTMSSSSSSDSSF